MCHEAIFDVATKEEKDEIMQIILEQVAMNNDHNNTEFELIHKLIGVTFQKFSRKTPTPRSAVWANGSAIKMRFSRSRNEQPRR